MESSQRQSSSRLLDAYTMHWLPFCYTYVLSTCLIGCRSARVCANPPQRLVCTSRACIPVASVCSSSTKTLAAFPSSQAGYPALALHFCLQCIRRRGPPTAVVTARGHWYDYRYFQPAPTQMTCHIAPSIGIVVYGITLVTPKGGMLGIRTTSSLHNLEDDDTGSLG